MVLIKKPEYFQQKKVIIIGAGTAGVLLANHLNQNPELNYEITAFVDDDPAKIGMSYLKKPVLGPISEIKNLVLKNKINEVLIAMPSATGENIRKIVKNCEGLKIPVKIMPSDYESSESLESGQAFFHPIREIKIEDFFRRKPSILNYQALKDNYKNKTVLVTGAAGSIGSEICRQLLELEPTKIVALDMAETPLHNLLINHKDTRIIPIIANIRDKKKIEDIIKTHKPSIIFHAAAYKHVPMMELSPDEAIKTNVFGTKNLIDIATDNLIEQFVLISTDKAVNPTSMMGASKRIAEMIMQCAASNNSLTKFAAVRFGNVINSQGSVIPLFESQIVKGGPITVTHPEVIRFFMTIQEASQLVIQSPLIGTSGNILALHMGEPVKIKNLAEDLIRLRGFEPHKDIQIKYIGMRPGEKMFEELSTNSETTTKTENERIYLISSNSITQEDLDKKLINLNNCLQESTERILTAINSIIPLNTPRENLFKPI